METEDQKKKKATWEKKRLEIWLSWLHLQAALILGLSLFPMVFLLYSVWKGLAAFPTWLKILAFSFSIGLGYFLFGTALIFVSVLVKNLWRFRIAPGLYTIHSKEALHWVGYNSLILIVNSAFLDVLRISPFQTLFYRLMGAKIGDGVHINTAGLADLSMLEIGDQVIIGGGVALICHASERGLLKLDRTRIGNRASIGLGSVIMPGCEIGEGASVAPCSYLPRGTKIPPRGAWGGNPVHDLRAERRQFPLSESSAS